MQRHAALQPLSRQHHQGLLAALLLQKGVARQASLVAMRQFIMHIWQNELAHHFDDEEKHLVTLCMDDRLKPLCDQMLEEHRKLRQLLWLSHKPGSGYEVIAHFSRLLEQHIRFEERVFFPAIEEELGADGLAPLAGHLAESTFHCSSFPDKFWE